MHPVSAEQAQHLLETAGGDRVARSVFVTGDTAPHDEQSHETKEADIFEDLSEMWFGKDHAQDREDQSPSWLE